MGQLPDKGLQSRGGSTEIRSGGRPSEIRFDSRIYRKAARGGYLEELSKEALVRIIREPKNAFLKQYKKLFQLDGVELEIEEDAILRLAEKAIERKTGARGLRSIMEHVMTDIMFDIPSRDDIRKCIITKSTIDHNTGPT